jgi:hypothetical protein
MGGAAVEIEIAEIGFARRPLGAIRLQDSAHPATMSEGSCIFPLTKIVNVRYRSLACERTLPRAPYSIGSKNQCRDHGFVTQAQSNPVGGYYAKVLCVLLFDRCKLRVRST